jgi:hypothetical protein
MAPASTQHGEFDWTLQLEADGCKFPDGQKLKTEIPHYDKE